jgi:hypothetical protein
MLNKIAVFIYEPVSGDLSRAFRGLSTANEFIQAGDDVKVIFDGSGVESVAAIVDPAHPLNGLYNSIKSNVEGACGFCSIAPSHNVKSKLDDAGIKLLTDNNGEASVRKYVREGYTILNF